MIKVTYVYSACVITETPDLKVLHDPWFTEGAYDGSWFHFPRIEDPVRAVGDVDVIYISHIHPDHYDPKFLKYYFSVFGEKRIIISDRKPNVLLNKMMLDGFMPEVINAEDTYQDGKTGIQIIPWRPEDPQVIDSWFIIRHGGHTVVNTNDNILSGQKDLELIKEITGPIDILLCGYTGAGGFPQTLANTDSTVLRGIAEGKKQAYLEVYRDSCKFLDAKINIPFAGKYILGGKLSCLNEFTCNGDPMEAMEYNPRTVILADNGGYISTDDLVPHGVRTEPYAQEDRDKRLKEISGAEMDYERLLSPDEADQLPIKRLLRLAFKNAAKRTTSEIDYFFWIPISPEEAVLINTKKSDPGMWFVPVSDSVPYPFQRIFIDVRYLFGLLTHVYHWNNAAVGSQYFSFIGDFGDTYPEEDRTDVYSRAHRFLNFFAV